jgi:RNA polymerase sigma-70 factor (ECF subfamily)
LCDDSDQPDESSDDAEMAIPLPEQIDRDLELVEYLQAGDSSYLAELISRNERWVRGVVYSVLTDVDMIDDVMQKVWLTAWQRLKELEDARRWRHWLYRTARNAAIDAGRKKTRRRRLWKRLGEEMLGRGEGESSNRPGPERTVAVKEEHRRVLRVIETMPAIYREPFVLRHLEGWTYKQIADALDLPVDTVGTRLVRARRLLQETLSDEE